MKIQSRQLIAAPFLLLSGFFLFSSVSSMVRAWHLGAGGFTFVLMFSISLVFFTGVPGILALKRRWEEFVKILGMIGAVALFVLISKQANELSRAVEKLCSPDYIGLGAVWGLCVVASPFVICIVAYKRFVPRIVRRIYRSEATTGSA